MGISVLVADADQATADAIAVGLDRQDVQVFGAVNEQEAFNLFLEKGPAAIFVDILLPRKGGMELLKRIRASIHGKNIPIIMMAVKIYPDMKREAMEDHQASGFVEKYKAVGQSRKILDPILLDKAKCTIDNAPGFFEKNIPEKGDLSAVPFPLIFNGLLKNGFIGRMNLINDKVKKIIFFDSGKVYYASSNRVSETLGRMMVQNRAISEETYQLALRVHQETRNRFGRILRDMDVLSDEELTGQLRRNLVFKVSEVFGWKSGSYVLTVFGEPPTRSGTTTGDDIRWEGAMRHIPLGVLLSILDPYRKHFILVKKNPEKFFAEMGIPEEPAPILKVGRDFAGRTVNEAINSALGDIEIRTLFGLLLTGYFFLSDSAECVSMTGMDDVENFRRVNEIRRQISVFRNQNHFRLLGVPFDADDEAVKSAFLEKARLYHPDTAGPNAPPELKSAMSEGFMVIKDSFEAIKEKEKRDRYLKKLLNPFEQDKIDGEEILEAESKYQEGLVALKKRDWEAAYKFLSAAVKLNPEEGDYYLSLGIARMNYKTSPESSALAEAKSLFMKAAEYDKTTSEPYYRLGILFKREGNYSMARDFFKRAIIRNPRHIESQRELKIMDARNLTDKKPGVMGKIIGKKGDK